MERRDGGGTRERMEDSSISFMGCRVKRSMEEVHHVFGPQQLSERPEPYKHSTGHVTPLKGSPSPGPHRN